MNFLNSDARNQARPPPVPDYYLDCRKMGILKSEVKLQLLFAFLLNGCLCQPWKHFSVDGVQTKMLNFKYLKIWKERKPSLWQSGGFLPMKASTAWILLEATPKDCSQSRQLASNNLGFRHSRRVVNLRQFEVKVDAIILFTLIYTRVYFHV